MLIMADVVPLVSSLQLPDLELDEVETLIFESKHGKMPLLLGPLTSPRNAMAVNTQKSRYRSDQRFTECVRYFSPPVQEQLCVRCQRVKDAPSAMHRGSSATHNNMVYVTPFNSNLVYQYVVSRDKWQSLPPCPYRNSGLVVVDGALTAVGGKEGTFCMSRVFTLRHSSWLSSSKWVERYPPMNTARSDPAVASFTSDDRLTNIIVIGGWGDGGWSTTVVELFKTGTQRWYKLASLPKPIMQPSAVICGGSLYVMKQDTTGFSCSLKALLSVVHPVKKKVALRRTRSWSSVQINEVSCWSPVHTNSPPMTPSWSPFQTNSISVIPARSPAQTNSTPTTPSCSPAKTAVTLPWHPLPQLPVRNATVSTLCGKLVVVGGQQVEDNSLVHSIYQLLDNEWVEIGSMNTARSMCFVECPVPHRIVIVGGVSDGTTSLKATELCSGS